MKTIVLLAAFAGALTVTSGCVRRPQNVQNAILEEAAREHNAVSAAVLEGRQHARNAKAFRGTKWIALLGPGQETDTKSQFGEPPDANYSSTYGETFQDKDGNHLASDKSYRLHLPVNVMWTHLWTLALYDNESRAPIQNRGGDSARSSHDKLKPNADGSVDLYFGPKAPDGLESNWIETVASKEFYIKFRFDTPKGDQQPLSWTMPDVELMK